MGVSDLNPIMSANMKTTYELWVMGNMQPIKVSHAPMFEHTAQILITY